MNYAQFIAGNPVTGHDRETREIIARMAADLIRFEATASETDAIRSLMGRGYRYGDIALLAEDALFEARQRIVAATVQGG